MKKLLMVLVLVASAVAASAQGLRPRRTLGSRLARPRPQATEGIVGKEAIKVIPTAREGGATWKYKESDKPLTNWADLSFDDKDWQEGVSGFGNSYGLRRTAWSGGANDLYLRKTFSISGTTGQIERVTLTYAIDDDIEVLLNGTELFSRKVGWWAKYASVDVTKDFKRLVLEPGKENVIAVKAHDRKPPCYADVGLEIVLSDTNQGKKNVSAQPAESQSVAHVTDVALIPFGATEWKYKMQGEVEENWKSPDFNDASWANGETPFGNGTWTTTCICLRKKFDCPYEDADIKYLQIREGIDDVLDIWLNGSHIFHWTYHGNSDLTTVVPRKLWEGLLRRKDNVLTVLARDWGGGRFVNVGLTAMVRQSVGRELVCPTEYVPADMKLIFPATKLADINVCSAVLTGDAVNWGRPTAVLASNIKSIGDVRKTLQFQRLENNVLKCACVELEQKGRDVWGRVLYCRRVNHCDVSCADFDTLLGPTHRVIDNDSEVANGSRGDGFALKEFTVYFASGVDCNGACTGTSTGLRRPGGLLGGSLRARRLQCQQAAQQVVQKKETVDGYTWSYRVNNGEATIVAENRGRFSCAVSPSPKGSLTIPSTLGGAKVTGIGRAALANCKDLVSVTMPPTVTSIGRDAFNGCHGVTSLAIPSSVKDIGIGAFLGCGVSSATISSNVVNIGYAAFAECAELKQINVDEGNQKYVSVDGVLYTKDRTVLIQCPGAVESVTLSEGMKNIYWHSLRGCRKLKSVTIPHSVSEIGAWAFSRCAGLTSLTIPGSVTSIGNNAFRECSGLRSVEMPTNMTSIAYAAFYDCDGLTSVTLPPCVKNIEGWAFGRCNGLKSVKMPECVTNIAGEAFRECGSLTSLLLPSSLTSIGNATFRACTNLTSVTIPSNVASIGVATFTDCTGLRQIDVAADNPKYASVGGVLYTKDRAEAVMCPGALTSVALPESVTSIGPCAFEGCGELTSVTMPECVTNIGPYAFKRCVKLTSLTIPEGVASIGRDALMECHGLTSLILPNSMTNIGWAAIAHCDSLKLLTIPSNVTVIAGAAFSHCCKLESVTIPPDVKSIEPWTFDCCEGLTSVTIPEHVTSIKGCAFRACTNLMSVTMCGGCPDSQRDVFKGCGKLKAIHVPSNSLSWAKMKDWQSIPLVFDGEAMSQEKLVQEAERLAQAAAEKARAEAEKAQREAERAEQRQQLLKIQEELKRVREQKAAAAAVKGDSVTACRTSNVLKSGVNVVAEKLQGCDFLLNKDFKKNAKFYLCLFSASWCGPCRREMPRIAKTYAETLKDDPDIELVHFSRDQNDEKALAWAKEHDVKFPVVKPNGGNPLDLHSRGIPHLFIVKADGTLVEEGHPMRIFNEEKFKEIKSGNIRSRTINLKDDERTELVNGYTWAYRVENDGATIRSVSPKPSGCVSIPATLGGVRVTSIGNRAFLDCYKMTSVTIPSSVTNIGNYTFGRCDRLTSVTIPSCVMSIEDSAFFGCDGLTSVTIPLSVTSIGSCAFNWCSGLTTILVDVDNPRYKSIDNCLLSKDGATLIRGPVSRCVVIPKDVTSIGDFAFAGCQGLTSVTLHEGMTSVGRYAFSGCSGLTPVTIPSSVTNIGSWAFSDCSGLMSVKIPTSVTSIGRSAFDGCSGLATILVDVDNPRYKSIDNCLLSKDGTTLIRGPVSRCVVIPKGVTRIGERAFSGCSGLTSVKIPTSVTSIGDRAFFRCSGLTSVTIPSSVTSIGESAFSGCSGLTSVTLPEGETSIGPDVFCGCSRLTSMTIPSDMINVVERAFGRDGSWGPSTKFLPSTNGMTTVVFEKSDADKNAGVRRVGSLGGSLRARRLQRMQTRRQAEQVAKKTEVQTEQEKQQREAERATQRQQLAAIREELKRARQAKAVAAKNECAASCDTNKPTSGKGVVAEKLGQCDFLLNKDFKKNAKFYLCLFSASWCGPCRREMPRIAKTYAETLKDDPDIDLIHFSRDQNDEKALAWAKEHDVKFPVVKPKGGNPLDLHSRGIPHLFIVKADGTLVEEGHPMRIFNEEKFRELKSGRPDVIAKAPGGDEKGAASKPGQSAGKMPSQFMPTKGLLASFDYDGGKETNAGYGEVRRENDHVAFVEGAADYDGFYKYSSRCGRYKQGDRFEEDYVVPELNFDRFTVACSFRPAHTNNWGQYFFRIGQTCYSILEVSLSRGRVSVYGGKLRNMSAPYVDGEWNWLVVSVDVAKREAWLSVNGCEPVSTSLPEDFFWFVPSDRVSGDKFRRLTFGNWQGGQRYLGQVDDLMVYDRALGREEFADICSQTVKAKGPAAASFEKPAPAKLPELRDDCWLFMPHDEQSVYWNGTIRTRDETLRVRREVDGLCVEPPGGIVDSVLDLTLPVVDASGQPLSIVGVGSECDPYCIRARKASLSEVRLPDTLKTIRKNAFAGCLELESIVIPERVREIGTFAFTDCGHLTKLEIRSKSVAIAKDAFSGSTPVGTDMPQKDWTAGPLTKEIKGDPKFEYAKEGRMAEPLFSFSYGDILFGRKYGSGGWGSTRMKGHEDWGEFDLRFVKLGTDQLAGVTLKWGKKVESEGVVDAAKTVAKELVALIEAKVKGKIDAPLYLPESEWPEYGNKRNRHARYSRLKPIGSSQTEVNGYTVKVDVYGGTKDVNVAVVITIIDSYMFKAWGMSPKI